MAGYQRDDEPNLYEWEMGASPFPSIKAGGLGFQAYINRIAYIHVNTHACVCARVLSMRNAMKTCGLLQPKLESAAAMCMGNLDTSYTSYLYVFSKCNPGY